MSGRIASVEVKIQHVRDRRERSRLHSRQRPTRTPDAQSAIDVGILRNPFWIVVINELEMQGLSENEPGDDNQSGANAKYDSPISNSRNRTWQRVLSRALESHLLDVTSSSAAHWTLQIFFLVETGTLQNLAPP